MFKSVCIIPSKYLSLGVMMVIGLYFLFFPNQSRGQDFHYSQFHNAELHLNPALTGVFNGDIRFMGNYRSQWASVPVNYQTANFVVDKKFRKRVDKNGFLAAGLEIDYDKAGDSHLQLIDLGLSASYTHMFSRYFFTTVGAGGYIAQRSFAMEDLLFENQFNTTTGVVDAGLPTGELFEKLGHVFPDASLGINFRWQDYNAQSLVDRLDNRSKVDFGIGVFHLLQPDQAFYSANEAKLPFRLSPYVLSTIQLGQSLDLVIDLTAQFQKPYTEYVGLAALKIHANRQLGKQLSFQVGLGGRVNAFSEIQDDALYPEFEIFYNSWRAGISYDINTSPFNIATGKRGGPELSIRYIIKHVKPLPQYRICPIL